MYIDYVDQKSKMAAITGLSHTNVRHHGKMYKSFFLEIKKKFDPEVQQLN